MGVSGSVPSRKHPSVRTIGGVQGFEVREWVSFEDPEEERTWVFDATFLRSSYH